MKTKLISLTLLLTLLLSAFCIPAFAEGTESGQTYVYEETYSGVLPTTIAVPSDSSATPTYSIVDGALVVDNTNGAGEATLQLINGLPTNVTDYYVEATITMLSLKDAEEGDTRYFALCSNFSNSTEYISATVRYNGKINFEQRNGSKYSAISTTSVSNISNLTPAVSEVMNTTFVLKVHFHDNTADLYINGQKLLEGVNTGYTPTGAIGIMLKKGVKASVDDVHYKVNEYGEISKAIIPDRTATDNFSMIEYDEVANPNCNPYGSWMAGQNTKYYLSDMTYDSLCTGGRTATKDATYKATEGTGIKLAQTHSFDKGFGVHPSGDWSETKDFGGGCYITVDIWEYTNPDGQYACDTFYAAVGLTNKDSAGVWFVVYGDKDDGNGFVQLACSQKMMLYNYGEMNIDVTGVHTLKLIVCADAGYSASASAWGECSLFKKDASAVKPDYTVQEEETEEEDEEVVTLAPSETKKKATETSAPETEKPSENTEEKKSGCSSFVSGSVFVAMSFALAGAFVTVRKKEH